MYKIVNGNITEMTAAETAAMEAASVVAPATQIEALKNQLFETDYKVIKSYEYQLVGKPATYDIAQLHAERQAIRDQITQLESQL